MVLIHVLTPGDGDFYVVRIEAVADPTPPNITAEDLERDLQAEMQQLIERMERMSPRELAEGVYCRMTVYLCGPCYRKWIEDPVGRERSGS